MSLIELTKKGLYCSVGGFYIDPWRKVDNAVITHGHSDHARHGHTHYLSASTSVNILRQRLGKKISLEGLPFGVDKMINRVRLSLHPAGHIVGSAQVRIEYKGEVWVISGDYKTEDDGLAEAFELVPCHTFITECTFGLPLYQWPKQQHVVDDINYWWSSNAQEGMISFISAYSLGKAQRLLHSIDKSIGPIFCHKTIHEMNEVYRASGFILPASRLLKPSTKKSDLRGAIILSPTSSLPGIRIHPSEMRLSLASGWMAIKANKSRQGASAGFLLSDHCDWVGLNEVVKGTGAEQVLTTHGYSDSFSRWLNEQGIHSKTLETHFEHNTEEGRA